MTRAFTILALALLTLSPVFASAQVLRTDTVGRPIRRYTFWLTAGTSYEFQTTDLQGAAPDTVISLRSGIASGVGATVAGSDGCLQPGGVWTWSRSCTSFAPTTTGNYALYIYAAHGVVNGTCDVQFRAGAGGWATVGNDVTFGGDRVAWNQSTSIARVRFETTHLRGQITSHAILVATPTNYDTRFVGWANSTRVTGAAAFDVDAGATGFAPGDWWMYFGSIVSSQVGDVRLVRNDWFLGTSADWDQDGLGLALETSLGTCDRATQALLGGALSCAAVGSRTAPACTGFNPSVPAEVERCRQQLRDTDHDGLRDDLEVYGHSSYNLLMPRYGADPAHADIFIELDAYDQNVSTLACEGFTAASLLGGAGVLGDDDPANGPTPAGAFVPLVNAVYANAPNWMNPDGTAGIRVHFDVGLSNAANPRDTTYGAWGGGNTCVPVPLPQRTPCPFTELFGGSPYPTWTAPNDPDCAGAPLVVFENQRSVGFRWGIDQAQPASMPSGEGTTIGIAFFANAVGGHVHEIGHTGGLNHGGPAGSIGEVAGGYSGYGIINGDIANNRPTYLSRMNYAMGYPGGIDGTNAAAFTSFSFSSSLIAGAYRASGMIERCPWPGVSVSALGPMPRVVLGVCSGSGAACSSPVDCPPLQACVTSCANIDWDRDGAIAAAGVSRRDASSPHDSRRRTLTTYAPDATRALILGGSSATIVNNVLMVTYSECGSGLTCTGYLQAESTGDCTLTPTPAAPDGLYPGCFTHGTPTPIYSVDGRAPVSMALVGYSSTGGGAANMAMHFAVTHDGALYRRWFTVVASATEAAEMTSPSSGSWTQVLAPGSVSTARDHRHVAVARMDTGSTLFILYQNPAGAHRQLTFDTVTMTASAVIVSAVIGGGSFTGTSESPGLAWADGRLYMARRSSTWAFVSIFRLLSTAAPDSAEEWELISDLTDRSATAGNLALALVTDADAPTVRRLRVVAHESVGTPPTTDARVYWDSARLSTPNWWTTWTSRGFATVYGIEFGPGAPAMVIDERATLPSETRGLRIYRAHRDPGPNTIGLSLFPFADGRDPTMLRADYNDWDGLQYGLCGVSAGYRAAHAGFASTTWTVTPWSSVDCGPSPVYPEL